jgi:D-alanyl-D-alanine carboxypeptidase (penicillin-binding protein 5/6)
MEKGMVVQSGNDAAIALAEHVAGSEQAFAQLMNAYAKKIGMTRSNFVNPHGLTAAGHVTTAHDLAILGRALIRDFPEAYSYNKIKEFTVGPITQPNRNLLLWRDPSVDGLKTGHTEEAGFCLVASAKRNDQRLIAVVFGTGSEAARATETAKLLGYGFNFFESKTFFKKGEAVQTFDVWKGAARSVKAGVASDFAAALPKAESAAYQTRIVPGAADVIAPLAAGAKLGTVELVSADGKVVMQQPLVALEAVEQGGFFRRVWDGIRLFFRGLFD